jgi:hypothetical protein
MKRIVFSLTILSCFIIFANENVDIYGNLSAGGGYDSYVPSLSKDSTQRKGSSEIIGDASLNIDIHDFTIGISTFMNAMHADEWSHSNLSSGLNLSWFRTFGDFDITVYGSGGFHAYDFNDIVAYYADGLLDIELFYNHSDNMSWYFDINGSYFHGIDKRLDYLKGPTIGFETGEYFYLGEGSDYLRISYKANFSFFKDADISSYPYIGDMGIFSVTSRNQSVSQTVTLKTKVFAGDFYIAASPYYRNMTMFKRDEWEYNDRIVKKRRVDHAFAFEVEPGWTPVENFSMYLFYAFEKNFSTLDNKDYTDENYMRHNIRLMLNYNF